MSDTNPFGKSRDASIVNQHGRGETGPHQISHVEHAAQHQQHGCAALHHAQSLPGFGAEKAVGQCGHVGGEVHTESGGA